MNNHDAASPSSGPPRRVRSRVEGLVQGVGFRPHVYRLARELALGGFVLNDERGVLLEVEGSEEGVGRFLERLPAEPPPLARIERVRSEAVTATGADSFEILPSVHAGTPDALVSPDTSTCAECLAEMHDPHDRRYRYPFINCTNCGPRFTIATGVPYDRALTTMASFPMCEHCHAEYEDPGDRRFHAQPNACPVCGPQARLLRRGSTLESNWIDGSDGDHVDGSQDAVRTAAELLAKGLIVAVKGLGGYHLACRADFQVAVAVLRARKQREDRPFALMVADLRTAEALIELDSSSRELLEDRARAIVIAPRRPGAAVAEAVAPDCPDLGVMLAYSPLHHLLLADFAEATLAADVQTGAGGLPDGAGGFGAGMRVPALVMTSGNRSEEPIAYQDADALSGLSQIADAFLIHDRPIHMRTDDSLLRHTRAGTVMFRRSRGYVPGAISLPVPAPRPLLACGAELKSTFCLARDGHAWVSHHIGDLKRFETLLSFREGVEHFQRLFAVSPQVVVHDLHPDYLSTGYALERAGDDPPIELLAVQHHHAHLAACLAEHGETGPALGVILDGSGYGTDGTVWGGELLAGDLSDFERAGHLRPVRLPGGDRAAAEPWRMACAWLTAAQEDGGLPALPAALAGAVSADRWETIARLSRSELAPLSTSAGRLFDAVAALCGARVAITYEGQAAIELEGLVDPTEQGAYPIELSDRAGVLELDPRPALLAVLRELTAQVPTGTVAARFHSGLAQAIVEACVDLAGARGLDTVVLSGGVFQNRRLLESVIDRLRPSGLRVLFPRLLPPNDGGVSFGQAAVAAARLSREPG